MTDMAGTETDVFDCVIVGGGIHGTYIANALSEKLGLDPKSLLLVDPNDRLLASFREKARACQMPALRSSYVQHLGLEPFALERFAAEQNRENELVSTVDYPPRPSLELFLNHADRVIADNDLHAVHRQAHVEGIAERPGERGYRLETSDGPLETTTCILAIGQGDRYRYPEWATGIDAIEHVWDGFDPAAEVDQTIVVGGGTTAGRLACELTETQSVRLLARHALEWETAEADSPWVTWRHIEKELHEQPPGSKARYEIASAAKHTATMPPYLYHELHHNLDAGQLGLEPGDVEAANSLEDGVELHLDRGAVLTADRVVLATGFEPVCDHPFVERVATTLGLERDYRGMPVLDDETLAWQTTDGAPTGLFVSGALALGTVGPFAGNLPGARRAAERILRGMGHALEADTASLWRPTPERT